MVHEPKTLGFWDPDPRIFFWIPVSDVPTINPNDNETLLTNGLTTFFIEGKPRSAPRNPPDCIIDSYVFDNLIFVDKLFAE